MASPGARNRKAAAPVSEELVALIHHSPTDHRRQEPQMQLKRWDELRELYWVGLYNCPTDFP
jgi:hypothetical protein